MGLPFSQVRRIRTQLTLRDHLINMNTTIDHLINMNTAIELYNSFTFLG